MASILFYNTPVISLTIYLETPDLAGQDQACIQCYYACPLSIYQFTWRPQTWQDKIRLVFNAITPVLYLYISLPGDLRSGKTRSVLCSMIWRVTVLYLIISLPGDPRPGRTRSGLYSMLRRLSSISSSRQPPSSVCIRRRFPFLKRWGAVWLLESGPRNKFKCLNFVKTEQLLI